MSTVHRRDFLSSALLAAGGLAASGLTLPLTAMAQTGDIVLGQSAPLSGSFAGQGTAYRDGALLFFNQINASGGINGRKIQLITLDDGYKAETAAENAKKLIEQENVLALFNFMFTNAIRGSMPVAVKAKVPYLSPYGGHPELFADKSGWVFTTRANFFDEAQYIVRHLHTVGITRVALVHYDSAAAKQLIEDLNKLLGEQNKKLMALGPMKLGSKDPAMAVKALADVDAQALIMGVSGDDAIAFVKAYQGARKTAMPQVFTRSLVGSSQLVRDLGPAATGIAVTALTPNPFRQVVPVSREYTAALAKRDPNAKPDFIEFEGYVAAKVFVEAARRAGRNLTRDSLANAYRSLSNYDAGGIVFSFGPNNTHGSKYVTLVMVGSNGRFVD
ncbi:MAG: ABC transporter substrate-binding protein [Burkholderiales bacterium]|jgi:branched-chain amino acid transport system substrate-binding protein|nr:ABC transporter substrate-binding protein [Burkholderiales bacterium]MCA3159043.1 ABC transporter substrate-binding protein [Burkholderiales bacterium]MCA3161464.1 ABC transporter substrate-binding protein [Burkholderiales bacterium]MCA3163721.1 ABC transporter substrate-binding protein [Burkholderiales bacterium]MCA3166510.1 ABC transporter substrate-binding protein [Burkholderiales bacterium]